VPLFLLIVGVFSLVVSFFNVSLFNVSPVGPTGTSPPKISHALTGLQDKVPYRRQKDR
jgi:hypothetical protein